MELGLNTTPPTEENQQTAAVTNTEPKPGDVQQPPQPEAQTEPPKTDGQTSPPAQGQQTVPVEADTFIENFNKRYGTTEYKTDDDIRKLFEAPKKISEYESRLSDYESVKQSAEQRQKKIEELESLNDPLKYFSSPEAYVAEQLKIKYPDRDSVILQEVVTTDVDNMDDFDLLIKAERLFNKKLPEGGRYVRDVLYKRYGLDSETSPAEWDGATKTQIAIDANRWRQQINDLKKEVNLPEIVTPEQREQMRADSLAKKTQDIAPVKDKFVSLDKFTHPDAEGFEWQVSTDYKAKAEDMFNGMFIDANMPMNEENMAAALRLRDANLLYENFGKIREAIIKQAQTDLQAKIDAESHNDVPPNTATATDQHTDENTQGIGKLVEGLLRR